MSRSLSWRHAGDTCATTAGVAEAAARWRVALQVPSRSSLLESTANAPALLMYIEVGAVTAVHEHAVRYLHVHMHVSTESVTAERLQRLI